MNDTPTKPRRRWFRFGLRTMFVVLTVLSLWIGPQAQWIVKRHIYLRDNPTAARLPGPHDPRPYAPGMLWMLGERGQPRLCVEVPGFWANRANHRTTPAPEAARARELFPEAIIEIVEKKHPRSSGILYYTWKPAQPWRWGKS